VKVPDKDLIDALPHFQTLEDIISFFLKEEEDLKLDDNFRPTTPTQILHVLNFAGQKRVCWRDQQTNALLRTSLSSASCRFQISAHLMALGSMVMCM